MTVSITTFCIKCHYAECRDLFIVLLNVILSVIMLNVVMLSVVAPSKYENANVKETNDQSFQNLP
jgi:hypothetical protein